MIIGPPPLATTSTWTPGMIPMDSRRVLALEPAVTATTNAFPPGSTDLSVFPEDMSFLNVPIFDCY
jgi:hypothetical protein